MIFQVYFCDSELAAEARRGKNFLGRIFSFPSLSSPFFSMTNIDFCNMVFGFSLFQLLVNFSNQINLKKNGAKVEKTFPLKLSVIVDDGSR